MMKQRGVAIGFWLLVGFSAGMVVSNLTTSQLQASANSDRLDNYVIAVGASPNQIIDLIWILDYKMGMLNCISLNRNGAVGGNSEIDLTTAFEVGKVSSAKTAPKFLMVTGKYAPGAQVSDLCYVADVTNGKMVVIGVQGPYSNDGTPARPPEVVTRFNFRKS